MSSAINEGGLSRGPMGGRSDNFTMQIDDERANELYGKLDAAAPLEKLEYKKALRNWAEVKLAEEQSRNYDDLTGIYADVNRWWEDSGGGQTDDEVKFGAANRKFIAAQTGQSAREMGDLYPSERDQWFLRNFQTQPKTEGEAFRLLQKSFENKKKIDEAYDMITGDVALAMFDKIDKGQEPDIPAMVTKWKEENAELLESLPNDWEENLLKASAEYYQTSEQMLRNQGGVLQRLYAHLVSATGRKVEGAPENDPKTVEDVSAMIDELAQLPPEVRQRGYTAILMAAKRQGMADKGFFEMAAEAWPRSLNMIRNGGTFKMEMDAQQRASVLQSDEPLVYSKARGMAVRPSGEALFFGSESEGNSEMAPLTPEDRARLLEQTQREVKRFDVLRELRDFADNRFDPVKSNAKGTVGKFVQDIFLQGPQSIAYTATAAIPAAGPFLAYYAIVADEYNQLRLQGLSPEQAKPLAAVSGVAQTAMEVFGARIIFGRSKIFNKIAARLEAKIINPARFGRLSQLGIRGTLAFGSENVTEGLQDLSTDTTREIFNVLGAEYPEVNWEQSLKQWTDSRLEVAAAVLLPVAAGHISSMYVERGVRGELEWKKKYIYGPLGLTDEEVVNIEDGTNPADKARRFSQVISAMPAERVQTIKDNAVKQSAQAEASQQDAATPTLETQKDAAGRMTYIVRDETGKEVYRSTKQAAAEEAFILTSARSTAAKFNEEKVQLRELVEWWNTADPKRADNEERVVRDTMQGTAQQKLEALQQANNKQGIEELHRRIAQSPYAGTPYDQIQILGEASVEQVGEMVFRSVIALNKNSRVRDAREEMHHTAVRMAVANGRASEQTMREWLDATERVFAEKGLGITLPRADMTDIVESMAVVQEAFENERISADVEMSLPQAFVDYIKRMIQVLAEVLKRGKAIREALDAGALPAEFEAFLVETTGVADQTAVDRARERTEQEVGAQQNYSIGELLSGKERQRRSRMAIRSNYTDESGLFDLKRAQEFYRQQQEIVNEQRSKATGREFYADKEIAGQAFGAIRQVQRDFDEYRSYENDTGKTDLVLREPPDIIITQDILDARKAGLPTYKAEVKPMLEAIAGKPSEDTFLFTILNSKGKAAGRATVRISPDYNNTLEIKETEVYLEFRSKGFGEALYREIAKFAQSRGLTEIHSDQVSPAAARVRAKLFAEPERPDYSPYDYRNKTRDATTGPPMTSLVDPTANYSIVRSIDHFKNDTRFDDLVKDGRVVTGVDVNDFIDQHILLHSPDNAFAGTIQLTDGEQIDGKGGVYYPVLYADKNYFWASTEAMIMRTANHLNEIGAKNGGRVLMGLVSAPVEKLFSSTSMSTGVVKFLNALTKDQRAGLSKDDLNAMLVAASKVEVVVQTKTKTTKKTFSTKLKASDSYAKNLAKIDELLAPDGSIFQVRKAFVESLADQISKHLNATPATAEYVAGILADAENKHAKNAIKRGKLSKASFLQGLGNMLTEPFLRDFQQHGNGKIYAIVEVQGEVKGIATTEHESYPATIVPVNKKSKVKLHVLKEAVDWQDVVGKETGQYATPQERLNLLPTSGMSATSLKVLGVKAGSSAEPLNYSIASKNSLRVRMTRQAMTDAALAQASWKDWYEEHQAVLDEFFGDHAQLFQDILSITSQAASVKANVGLALRAFGLYVRGEPFDGMLRGEEKRGFLPAVIKNLERHRENDQLQGQKIRAYKASNDGEVDQAVVDRHIAQLIFGVKSPSKAQFAKAQKILTEIANEIGWTPRQVQAALWAHSIYKSGKTPESYGDYLKKLESRGTIEQRIGDLGRRGPSGDADGGGRGRYAPDGAAEGTGVDNYSIATSGEMRDDRGMLASIDDAEYLNRVAEGDLEGAKRTLGSVLGSSGIPIVYLADIDNPAGGWKMFPATFVRFGLPPTDGPSGIYKGAERIGQEAGVSVYAAWKDPKTAKYVIRSGGVSEADSGGRQAYEVVGQQLDDVGADEEALLKTGDVRVVREIPLSDITDDNDPRVGYDGSDFEESETPYWNNAPDLLDPIVLYDAQGNIVPPSVRFPSQNYSISTQSEIDRVQKAMDRLARSPSERIAQYAALKERLAAALERNKPIMQSMRGDTLPQDFDRTRLLNDLGFLDYILKVLPPEVRGRVGGYTNLAAIAPVDVYKGDQKVSEAKNPAGAIISAWMREGQNIGQAQKNTALPEGYSTVANTTDERRDKTVANFLIDRLKKIDRELERYYKRDLMERIFSVLDKSRPKAGDSGVKRSTLGPETQKFADMVYRASLLDDEQTAARLTAIEAEITNIQPKDSTPEAVAQSQQRISQLSEEWTIVNTFGDLKNRPSETMAYGLEWLQGQLKAGREAWNIKETARIEENRQRVADALVMLGKPTDKGRFENPTALKRFLQSINALDLDHKSFEQFATIIFGDKLGGYFSEKLRQADISAAKAELENTKKILNALREGAKAAGTSTGKALVKFKREESNVIRKLEGRKVKNTEIAIDLAKKIVRGLADRGSLSQADVQTLADELASLPRDTKKQYVTIKQVIYRGDETRISMNRATAMQLWLSWQQSDIQEKMRREGWNDDSAEDLENLLSDPVSQAILKVTRSIYGGGYALTNPIYSRMFGMNMPMVKNYAPARFLNAKEVKDVSLDGSPLTAGGQPSFAKSRVTHSAKIANKDGLAVLQQHIAQQAHWVAFAELTREYRSLLSNPEVRDAITQRYGEDVLTTADMWAEQMEQRGGNKGREIAWINNMLGAAIGGQSVSLLGFNLKSLMMQSDNLMRFALALDSRQIASAMSDPAGLMRAIRKVWETDLLQTRLEGGATAETRFLFSRFVSMFRRGAKISELAMMPMNYVDSAGLSISGAIVYQAAFKDAVESGMTEQMADQAAKDAVEAMIYRYGQPVLMGQKSNIENSGNVFAKTFFLFMSDPRLKTALLADSIRGLTTGSGNWKDHVRRIVAVEMMAIVSHVLATAFRDATSDDDDEDLWSMGGFARALLLAPLQGYFLVGSVSEVVLSRLAEARWFTPTQNPFIRTADTAFKAFNNLDDAFNFDDPDALVKEWTNITRSIAFAPPLAAPAVIMNLVRPLVQAWERMDDDQ